MHDTGHHLSRLSPPERYHQACLHGSVFELVQLIELDLCAAVQQDVCSVLEKHSSWVDFLSLTQLYLLNQAIAPPAFQQRSRSWQSGWEQAREAA